MPSQTERVMGALVRAGARGITSVDFLLPNVIDGGKPITRLAARINDARDQGHAIVVDGERNSCAVYKLASAVSPRPASGAPDEPPRVTPTLLHGAGRGETPDASTGAPGSSRDHALSDSSPGAPQLFDTLDQEFDSMIPPLSPYEEDAA